MMREHRRRYNEDVLEAAVQALHEIGELVEEHDVDHIVEAVRKRLVPRDAVHPADAVVLEDVAILEAAVHYLSKQEDAEVKAGRPEEAYVLHHIVRGLRSALASQSELASAQETNEEGSDG